MQILKIKTKKRTLGDFGERAAAKFLKRSGYRILEKNYEAQGHEIDIICTDKEYLVYAEVKTRTLGRTNPNEPRPASAVTPEKQSRIITAARMHSGCNKYGRHKAKKRRMDVIEVFVNEENGKKTVAEIKHLKNAFTADTAKYIPQKERTYQQ